MGARCSPRRPALVANLTFDETLLTHPQTHQCSQYGDFSGKQLHVCNHLTQGLCLLLIQLDGYQTA